MKRDNNIEYFVNRLCFSIYCFNKYGFHLIGRAVLPLGYFIRRIIYFNGIICKKRTPQEIKKGVMDSIAAQERMYNTDYDNVGDSVSIVIWIILIDCFFFLSLFRFLIPNNDIIFICLGVSTIVAFVLSFIYLNMDNKYETYFKRFERNKSTQRKWHYISGAFIAGSILCLFLSIYIWS